MERKSIDIYGTPGRPRGPPHAGEGDGGARCHTALVLAVKVVGERGATWPRPPMTVLLTVTLFDLIIRCGRHLTCP